MFIEMVTDDDITKKTAQLKLSGNKYSGAPTYNLSYNLDYNSYETDPANTILDCLNVAIPLLIQEMG